MSLGKAMIHARKQKSIAKAAGYAAGDYTAIQPNHMLQMPVLVLNASYEPINICGARRAWFWCSRELRAPRRSTASPSMPSATTSPCLRSSACWSTGASPTRPAPLAQKHPAPRPQHLPVLRRSSAPRRPHAGPCDPPLPRRQFDLGEPGGCCHSCNRQKGNRLLNELDDMVLMREPRPFSLHTSRQIMRMLGRSDDRWRKYLFY